MKKSSPEMKRVHVIVSGRVQGVGFRYFAVQEAQRIGVKGWVRNTPDGCVETVAEGSDGQLNEFLASLQTGPAFGYVTNCDVSWLDATGEYNRFNVSF